MGDGVVTDLMPAGPLGVDGVLEVAGGRQDAGIDSDGVAEGLGGLVVVVGVADGAPVGEEDEPAQVVGGFAPPPGRSPDGPRPPVRF